MRYLDSADRRPEQTLLSWLDDALDDAAEVAIQTGYFSWSGLEPFESELQDLLVRGGRFDLVVGGNENGVYEADLSRVLDLIDGHARATLVLVGGSDVLMHPKTYYVRRGNNVELALVGSANLSGSGLAGNIETGLALLSTDDSGAPFIEIRDAIQAWQGRADDPSDLNAFWVTKANLAELVRTGRVSPAARPPRAGSPGASGGGTPHPFGAFGRIATRLTGRSRGSGGPSGVSRSAAGGLPGAGLAGTGSSPAGSSATLGSPGLGTGVPSTPPASSSSVPAVGTPAVRPAFPNGAQGIVKLLTAMDTKSFRGERGTTHITVARQLANYLPMRPAGINGEPRLDLDLSFELDALPSASFSNQRRGSQPNLTHVGAGHSGPSHSDLRLNYLKSIAKQVLAACQAAGVPAPHAGDIAAVVFDTPTRARIVVVRQQPLRGQLQGYLTAAGTAGWAWIPGNVVI